MSSLRMRLAALTRDTRGTASTEYVVLLVCICVGGLLAWQFFGRVILRIITGDGD